MSYKFLKELVIVNNEEYEFGYENGSNEPNKLIKALTNFMDEWINLEMYGLVITIM
jgi:hypothetical protein